MKWTTLRSGGDLKANLRLRAALVLTRIDYREVMFSDEIPNGDSDSLKAKKAAFTFRFGLVLKPTLDYPNPTCKF